MFNRSNVLSFSVLISECHQLKIRFINNSDQIRKCQEVPNVWDLQELIYRTAFGAHIDLAVHMDTSEAKALLLSGSSDVAGW